MINDDGYGLKRFRWGNALFRNIVSFSLDEKRGGHYFTVIILQRFKKN